MQGKSPAGLHQPQPLLHKKGLQTTPQTPRQSLARDLNKILQRPQYFLCFGIAGRRDILFLSNTMLKHSGNATRLGADSPDERGWVGANAESGGIILYNIIIYFYFLIMFEIETIIVAREAALVPMESHWESWAGSRGPFVGTTISQPGSILPFEALAIVPF